jgi:reverse gyrase
MRKPLLLLSGAPSRPVCCRQPGQAAQSFAHAGEYISFIGAQHHEITKDMMSYTSAVAHGKSARKIENRRKEMLQTVTEARRKIASLPPYQGDKSLRDSTARFLLAYYHISTTTTARS